MLNALELAGFKSFPDRTRFEFPPGISVIVGPNGSGKSNIVDAIKWVLGEQSPKSLRGKEMADVIFKGSSGPSGRRQANTAEVTIFLDNSDRRLRWESDEVTVTRRVYRSGEGEYMLNGEPCRLKDIRNLFRGTGIGTDAYSLIEQGKVDQLLQATARERRAIFEEAAGISRFKAKKIETERRLDRVEQNLVRLADIVGEVETTYKRVKRQATKASQYVESSSRLKELRTYVGQKDWRELSEQLKQITHQRLSLEREIGQANEQLRRWDTESTNADRQLSLCSTHLQELQEQASESMQAVAEQRSQISLARNQCASQESQIRKLRDSLETWDGKLGEARESLQNLMEQQETAEKKLESTRQQLEQSESSLTAIQSKIRETRSSTDADKLTASELADRIATLRQSLGVADSKSGTLKKNSHRLRQLVAAATADIDVKQNELAEINDQEAKLRHEVEQKDSTIQQALQEQKQRLRAFEESDKLLADLQQEHAVASQRSSLIQELESQQEGVPAGVRKLLSFSQSKPDPVYEQVVGLVADLIKVNVEYAELVDLALGPASQHVVVNGTGIIQQVACGELRLEGRVGLIQQFPQSDIPAAETEPLNHQAGVIGRLDQVIQAQPEYHQVARFLLGTTWLVKSLPVAIRIKNDVTDATRFRLITLAGEIIEADGTIICGSRTGKMGIVSRRSELRALLQRLQQLDAEIARMQRRRAALAEQRTQHDARVEDLIGEHSGVAARLAEVNRQSAVLNREIEQLQQRRSVDEAEWEEVEQSISACQQQIDEQSRDLHRAEARIAGLDESVRRAEQSIQEWEHERESLQQQVTSEKVAFAKAEQSLQEITGQLLATKKLEQESQQARRQTRSELADYLWQRRSSSSTIAHSEKQLEQLKRQQQELQSQVNARQRERTELEETRRDRAKQQASVREDIRTRQDQLHQIQLRQQDLDMQRQQLAERIREDYDVEIQELAEIQTAPPESRAEIDQEIDDLRKKLADIGPVNLDALEELQAIESRYQTLRHQYDDLHDASQTLLKIIARINNDSRKVFLETLDQIRGNFQQMFRQTFGGGQADLVLEEGVDVLEAGIEIKATPPGKPEFSNSLLSGGERALTAVSLLMAIFKFRPSPFCILDEVDAPFDEANIGRFIDVLRSFLGWTKFIIVTHSKKTMTAADTLYGITMQESGVSKRVSIRFENVKQTPPAVAIATTEGTGSG